MKTEILLALLKKHIRIVMIRVYAHLRFVRKRKTFTKIMIARVPPRPIPSDSVTAGGAPAGDVPAGSVAAAVSPRPMPVFEGGIDGFTRDGFIAGWACRPGIVARAHVRVRWEDEIIGEAVAEEFRLDLLHAGKGLGHCGFFARLKRELPPGEHVFALVAVAEDGGEVEIARHLPLVMPADPEIRARLPDSPSERRIWRDEDVLGHLAQFDLPRQCREMGVDRFVDVTYRFALDRWADDSARGLYPSILEKASLTAEAFFSIILTSDERKGRQAPLPSPFDYRFPFSTYATGAAPG